MTGDDVYWVRKVLSSGIVTGPVLELGTGYGGATSGGIVREFGFEYFGTDLAPAPTVNFVADFEKPEDLGVFDKARPFGTIFNFNVLEHTFDPIRILDHSATLVKSGGVMVLIAPAVWPLHNYPMDAWRLLPNFFEEYAKRRGFTLLEDHFDYIGHGPVRNYRNADGSYAFPLPASDPKRFRYGRAIHRIFNTFGRAMLQPSHVGIGAVLRK